ncbi:MAG: hypothetical protein ICV78_07680 [Tolypothrix sp. Co-bin9]|nr:hypothetical protein [Tolypothrix sp. Co-bin9]
MFHFRSNCPKQKKCDRHFLSGKFHTVLINTVIFNLDSGFRKDFCEVRSRLAFRYIHQTQLQA